MNRRNFLKTTSGLAACLAGLRAPYAWSAAGQASDEDLLAEAQARISQHRQSQATVVVRQGKRRPVPGTQVRIEQQRHEFLFGCNCFRFDRLENPSLEADYRSRFAAVFNYATLGFYWAAYERRRGQPQYDYTDRVLAWCRDQGITRKGHPLVWDYADPPWLPRDFAEIGRLSHERVREIVTRFKGRLDMWDVVNEPTHLGRFNTRTGEWAMSLGAVPYVKEHLRIARAANPKAVLLVNDYRTDRPFYQILDALRENGLLMYDAVGIQSHMHGGGWPLRQIWTVCDTYARLSVPVHFTETTIVSGPRVNDQQWGDTTVAGEVSQAEYVPKFYTMLFAHPAVRAITWWDFSDNQAWQRAAAGWVRKDMSPKPVYERMVDLIKKAWRTRTEGFTDHTGAFSCRAFYGVHRVTVQTPDGKKGSQEIEVKRGSDNRFGIELAPSAERKALNSSADERR